MPDGRSRRTTRAARQWLIDRLASLGKGVIIAVVAVAFLLACLAAGVLVGIGSSPGFWRILDDHTPRWTGVALLIALILGAVWGWVRLTGIPAITEEALDELRHGDVVPLAESDREDETPRQRRRRRRRERRARRRR